MSSRAVLAHPWVSGFCAGVEVVKASTWEQPFHKRISAARALELSVLKTTLMLQVWW
jgi:hypothetical protein